MSDRSPAFEPPATDEAAAAATAMTDPSARSYPRPARAWWALGVLSLLYALSLLDRQIISLLVTDIRRDLGITDFELGMVTGIAFAAFYVSFGLLFGWMADRWSRRGIIYAGVSIWSAAAMACGLARNFGQLAGARFGLGAGEAALNPAAYSLITDSFPPRRLSLALSVFSSGAHLGTALSMLLGGALIALLPAEGITLPLLGHLAPWRAVFVLIGLPGLLIALLVWTIREPGRHLPAAAERRSFADTLRFMRGNARLFASHFLGLGLLTSAAYSFNIWTPVFLERRFGLPIHEIATILASTFFVGSSIGTIMAGMLADRWFERRKDIHMLMIAGLAACIYASVLLAVTAPSVPIFILGSIGFAFFSAYGGLAIVPLQLVTPPHYRGQVAAFYLFVFNLLGMGVGPTLTGAFTTYLFADDAMVGWSILLSCSLLIPAAITLLLSVRGTVRAAIERGGAAA